LVNIVLVKYVLKACISDKIIWTFLSAFIARSSISVFLGSSAVIEQEQFSLVFSAGSLRLLSALGLTLFIVFFVRRSFESRDIEFLLSRPISKITLLASYLCTFFIIALIMACVVSACVFSVGYDTLMTSLNGFLLWGASLAAELLMIACISFFFAALLSNAASAAMFTLLFYGLGRLMGQILSIIETGQLQSSFAGIMEFVMQVISVVTPRFDLMGQTSWLLYGVQNFGEWGFVMLQPVVFSALIFTALSYDFSKKEF
jgi:hypothetical protein